MILGPTGLIGFGSRRRSASGGGGALEASLIGAVEIYDSNYGGGSSQTRTVTIPSGGGVLVVFTWCSDSDLNPSDVTIDGDSLSEEIAGTDKFNVWAGSTSKSGSLDIVITANFSAQSKVFLAFGWINSSSAVVDDSNVVAHGFVAGGVSTINTIDIDSNGVALSMIVITSRDDFSQNFVDEEKLDDATNSWLVSGIILTRSTATGLATEMDFSKDGSPGWNCGRVALSFV